MVIYFIMFPTHSYFLKSSYVIFFGLLYGYM